MAPTRWACFKPVATWWHDYLPYQACHIPDRTGPTIPGTKLDCLSLCWNWNLNWVCCNLSWPYHSWYKTGLACLFAETGTWIGFVAISLGPTISGTKLDLLVSYWNWNLNWVCCNLSRPDYSWYKTGLACLLLKLELELGLLQFSLGCALTMSSFR
jgi:hypothetical protein